MDPVPNSPSNSTADPAVGQQEVDTAQLPAEAKQKFYVVCAPDAGDVRLMEFGSLVDLAKELHAIQRMVRPGWLYIFEGKRVIFSEARPSLALAYDGHDEMLEVAISTEPTKFSQDGRLD